MVSYNAGWWVRQGRGMLWERSKNCSGRRRWLGLIGGGLLLESGCVKMTVANQEQFNGGSRVFYAPTIVGGYII